MSARGPGRCQEEFFIVQAIVGADVRRLKLLGAAIKPGLTTETKQPANTRIITDLASNGQFGFPGQL
jgi:hypothetical protein